MEEHAVPAARPPVESNGHRPRAIDRARKAFHLVGRRLLEAVPEWVDEEGRPLEVYATPITQADLEAITARVPKGGYEETVALLIMKLRDETNQPLFTWQDKHTLMTEVESAVLIRLKNAVWNLSSIQTVDQARQILGDDKALAFRVRLARVMGKSLDEVNSWAPDTLTLFCADWLMELEEKRQDIGG